MYMLLVLLLLQLPMCALNKWVNIISACVSSQCDGVLDEKSRVICIIRNCVWRDKGD